MNQLQKNGWGSFQEILNNKKILKNQLDSVQEIEDFFYNAIENSEAYTTLLRTFLNDFIVEKEINKDFFDKIENLYLHELIFLKKIIDKNSELDEEEKDFLKNTIKIHHEKLSKYGTIKERKEIVNSLIYKRSLQVGKGKSFLISTRKSFFGYSIIIEFLFPVPTRQSNSIKNFLGKVINDLNNEIGNLTYKFSLSYDSFDGGDNSIIKIDYSEDIESKNDYKERRKELIKSKKENFLIMKEGFFDNYKNDGIFSDYEITIGLGEDGEMIKTNVKEIDAMLVVGNSRSGKTHFLKNLVIDSLSNGYLNSSKLILIDGNKDGSFRDFEYLKESCESIGRKEDFIISSDTNESEEILRQIFEKELLERKKIIKREFVKENGRSKLNDITLLDRLGVGLKDIFIIIDGVKFNNPNSGIKKIIEKQILTKSFFTLKDCGIHLIVSSSSYKGNQYLISKDIIEGFKTKITFKNTKEGYSNVLMENKISSNSINLLGMGDGIISFIDSYQERSVDNYKRYKFNEEENKKTLIRFQSSYIEDSQIRTLVSEISRFLKLKKDVNELLDEESQTI